MEAQTQPTQGIDSQMASAYIAFASTNHPKPKKAESAFDRLKKHINRKDFGESKNAVLYVRVCEELREIGDKHDVHIADTLLGAMAYDGKAWRITDRRMFTNKLGELAEVMGVSATLARQFRFREDLFKQFAVSFFREMPEPDPANVKINLNNCTLNAGTGEITAHNPDDMFLYVLDFDYDINATCENFLATLKEILPDEDARMVLQEYVGYLFVFGLKLEKFLTLYGSGSNGKSVVLDIISALLGSDNVCNIPLQSICRDNSPYIPKLAGKLANICNDVGTKLEDTSILKRIASGEPITGRALYKDPVEISVYAKLLFALNELPQTNDFSKGYWRRQLIVPFNVEIPESKQDKTLAKRIIENELPGVLNWALDGLRRIMKNQAFTECKSAENQLKLYQQESDNVAQFIQDAELHTKQGERFLFKDLFSQYQEFCRENGYRSCNKGNFKNRLQRQGLEVRNGAGNALYVFIGEVTESSSLPF